MDCIINKKEIVLSRKVLFFILINVIFVAFWCYYLVKGGIQYCN